MESSGPWAEAHPGERPVEHYLRVFGELRSLAANRGRSERLRVLDDMYEFGQADKLSRFISDSEFRPGQDDLALYAAGCLWNLGKRGWVRECLPDVISRIELHKDPTVADADHRLLQAGQEFQKYVEAHSAGQDPAS